jgi:hypothetical protein
MRSGLGLMIHTYGGLYEHSCFAGGSSFPDFTVLERRAPLELRMFVDALNSVSRLEEE